MLQISAAARGRRRSCQASTLPLLAAAAAAGDPERYHARLQRSFPALAFSVCPLARHNNTRHLSCGFLGALSISNLPGD